jgi:hypothetical protein
VRRGIRDLGAGGSFGEGGVGGEVDLVGVKWGLMGCAFLCDLWRLTG